MRRLFTHDLGWKFFSLLLAVVIYFTVRTISVDSPNGVNPLGDWQARTLTNQPVFVVASAADVREYRVQPEQVNVEISARPEVLAALQEKDIHVTVDLTEVESARNLRQRVEVSAPPGVTVLRVTPNDVSIVVPPRRK